MVREHRRMWIVLQIDSGSIWLAAPPEGEDDFWDNFEPHPVPSDYLLSRSLSTSPTCPAWLCAARGCCRPRVTAKRRYRAKAESCGRWGGGAPPPLRTAGGGVGFMLRSCATNTLIPPSKSHRWCG